MNINHLLFAAAIVTGSTSIGNGAERAQRSDHCPTAEARADKNVERACGDRNIKACGEAVKHRDHIADKCVLR